MKDIAHTKTKDKERNQIPIRQSNTRHT